MDINNLRNYFPNKKSVPKSQGERCECLGDGRIGSLGHIKFPW